MESFPKRETEKWLPLINLLKLTWLCSRSLLFKHKRLGSFLVVQCFFGWWRNLPFALRKETQGLGHSMNISPLSTGEAGGKVHLWLVRERRNMMTLYNASHWDETRAWQNDITKRGASPDLNKSGFVLWYKMDNSSWYLSLHWTETSPDRS